MNGRVGPARKWCGFKAGDEGIRHVNGHRAFKIDGVHNMVRKEL